MMKIKLVPFIVVIVGIILTTYVFVRAYSVSITHDEAFSWNNVVNHSFMEIVSYNTSPGPAIPNNHILNSLLMKFCAWLFGPSSFAVRIPNLLAYVFFLLFSFLVCKRLKKPVLIVSAFLLLNLNPFMLEFFSLARGYGLANLFMMGTIYFLMKWKENNSVRTLFAGFLFAFLSVLSNFSLLQFYLGVLVVVGCILINQRKKKQVGDAKQNGSMLHIAMILALTTILLGIILFEPLRKILKWHTTFGGVKGFWVDTASDLVGSYCMSSSYYELLYPFLKIIVVLFSLVIIAGAVKSVVKKDFFNDTLFISLLLIIPIAIYMIEHSLWKTEFLVARAAQYLMPLFILSFIFSLDYLSQKINVYSSAILAIGAMIHFSNCINISHTQQWQYDCDNKNALEIINSTIKKNTDSPLSIGITWTLEPGLNFYRTTQKMNWLSKFTRESVEKKNFDLYYVTYADTSFLRSKGKIIFQKFPLSDTYLMK